MKKQIQFRIIELPTHQILITKDWDEDEDCSPILVITIFHDGIKANQKLGFDKEKKRDKAFDSFNEEHAKSMLESFLQMLT